MAVSEERARGMWRLVEPVHAVVYFPPVADPVYTDLGLNGFWMTYFASRGAALGAVGPEVVEALFFVFHPSLVQRALPDAWLAASPEDVLAARAALADRRLRDALGDRAEGEDVATAAALAVPIARSVPLAGRPLGAAHHALPLPSDDAPLAQLWWAATVLREHRFDGHVAALVTAGIDGCESLVLAGASGAAGPDGGALLQASRRWPDDEWAAAIGRLTARGWYDPDRGGLTDAGRQAHVDVETATDRSAATAYEHSPDAALDRLATALRPLVTAIASAAAMPFPNPIGLDPHSA